MPSSPRAVYVKPRSNRATRMPVLPRQESWSIETRSVSEAPSLTLRVTMRIFRAEVIELLRRGAARLAMAIRD
jgi:hypothetical protein